MRILICPDKFKGTLNSEEVTNAINNGIFEVDAAIETIPFPIADGGEGTAEILGNYFNANPIKISVKDPLFREIKAVYYYSEYNRTAFIEMSAASGLQLLKENERNPLKTSTYGSGQLIKHAINKGAKIIIFGLGGSATNDAGIGMLNAMGFNFFDNDVNELLPIGENLNIITNIDVPAEPFYNGIEIIAAVDVLNPFYGQNGAAYVYAGQKGANNEQIKQLDKGLRNFADIVKFKFKSDISQIPGSGAAGGLGAACLIFLNAKLKNGADTVFELTNFEDKVKNSDLIITGEGKFDYQTFKGKAVSGVLTLAEKYKKPVAVICGVNEISKKEMDLKELFTVKTLFETEVSNTTAVANSEELIISKTKEIIDEFTNL